LLAKLLNNLQLLYSILGQGVPDDLEGEEEIPASKTDKKDEEEVEEKKE